MWKSGNLGKDRTPSCDSECPTLIVSRGEELIELALEELISTRQAKSPCHCESNVLQASERLRAEVKD